MTERRRRQLPSLRRCSVQVWLRRLDQVREGQQPIHTEMSIGERLDLAMMLMAEGLARLEEQAKEQAKGRRTRPGAVDRLLYKFAELDHWWVEAGRR